MFPLGISGHRRVMSSAQSDWSSSNLCLLPANLSLPESSFFDSWLFELVSAERTIENRRVLYYTSITLTENAGNRIKLVKIQMKNSMIQFCEQRTCSFLHSYMYVELHSCPALLFEFGKKTTLVSSIESYDKKEKNKQIMMH